MQAPVSEDTIAGRYAQTLFISASKESQLYNVLQDMSYINEMYETTQFFRIFCDNSGLNASQISKISEELGKQGEFSKTTMRFLNLLGENKRYMYVNEVAKKFIKCYMLLTKEEKIRIVSAQELTESEKAEVKKSMEENPENKGKIFIIDFEVKPEIVGGLQMFTENKFMDLSLHSRLEKIKGEINKMI